MIVFDTVRRYLEYKGYDVNYVSNFTDVDDKIIAKAIEEGVSAEEISNQLHCRVQKGHGRYECKAGYHSSAGDSGNRRNDRHDPDLNRTKDLLMQARRNRILPCKEF